jgi:DNA-binding winged helix-turn-helix (wHTH) protein
MGDQSRQLHQRLIDRPGSAAKNVSIGDPCVLVNRSGKIISNGERMARVWPDLAVQEVGLSFYIAHLRRAVSDSQGGERDVTNVPGRGYCFVAAGGRTASPSTQHLDGCGDL